MSYKESIPCINSPPLALPLSVKEVKTGVSASSGGPFSRSGYAKKAPMAVPPPKKAISADPIVPLPQR